MKSLLSFLMIATIATTPLVVSAQKGDINVGAHAGANFSKLCCGSMTINEDYDFAAGPAFGLTASYNVNSWLSLAGELNYTTQGGRKNGMQAVSTNGTTLYANFDNRIKLNYLELPVMARATFGKTIKYYANLGVFAGYILSANQKGSGNSSYYLDANGRNFYGGENHVVSFDKENNIQDDVRAFNFGLTGGIGAGYTFGKHGIWLDGRYVMGLPNIRENTTFNGENSTGSIMALVGYTYTITK